MDNPILFLIAAIIGSAAFTELMKFIKSLFDKKEKAEIKKTEKQVKLLDYEVNEAKLKSEKNLSEYYRDSYAKVINRLGEVEEQLKKTQEQLSNTNELLKKNNDQVKKMKSDIRSYIKTINAQNKELIILRKRCSKEECKDKVA